MSTFWNEVDARLADARSEISCRCDVSLRDVIHAFGVCRGGRARFARSDISCGCDILLSQCDISLRDVIYACGVCRGGVAEYSSWVD
ncbi:MAG: hypothetical protein IJC18_05635 [Clostridia bacterium]|nr:hypothetical protein [Clostridia bacterium]